MKMTVRFLLFRYEVLSRIGNFSHCLNFMITTIFFTALSWAGAAAPMDSLRLETQNGQKFIIHQIDEKETLYAISRRYGVPITSILEHNPTADGGLSVGNQLKIPYTPKVRTQTSNGLLHRVAPKETMYSIAKLYNVSIEDIKSWNNLKDNALNTGQDILIKKKNTLNETKAPAMQSVSATHTVAAKETLYSLARQYNITVQQLKEWNGIQGDDLKLGQVLFITAPMNTNTSSVAEVKTEPKQNTVITSSNTQTTTPTPIKETTIKISEKVTGTDEVREAGIAELIEGTEGNRKYLALHRTAKTGSILKIRNELNNREVFVRVVGPLPNTGVNDKIVIKISKSAYDRLGAIDPKFRVEVTYYK